MSFHKPAWERCLSMQRKEAGVCVDEHTTAKTSPAVFGPARRWPYWRSSNTRSARASRGLRFSIQYHLHSTEAWLKTAAPGSRRRFARPQPATRALTVAGALHRLDLREGATRVPPLHPRPDRSRPTRLMRLKGTQACSRCEWRTRRETVTKPPCGCLQLSYRHARIGRVVSVAKQMASLLLSSQSRLALSLGIHR